MKPLAPMILALALAAAPASADAPPQPPSHGFSFEFELDEGFGLMEQGARMILRGLLDQLEPQLREFAEEIDDLGAYHAPEILPNGDIILRRKQPAEPPATPEPRPDPEAEPEAEPADPDAIIDL